MNQMDQILERVQALPPLPTAVVDVLGLMQDPDVDPGAVASAISYDPGLTVNVLRMANSTMFAGNNTVGSIQEACVRLGTKNVMSLVVCSAVGPMAQGSVDGYELADGSLWEHCVSVAVATEQFARTLGIRAASEAFTAGLLCDIGKLVLGGFVQGVAEAIRSLAFSRGLSFERAERQLLGFDHAEAGSALLERWKLPDSVVAVVRWHHEPELCPGDAQRIAYLVHVADHACTAAGLGGGADGTNYRLSPEAVSHTGLTPEHMEIAMCNTVSQLEEVRERLCPAPVQQMS